MKIDSSFGASTRNAVVAFQKLAGLTADGIVGRQTWDILVRAYRETQSIVPPISQKIPAYPGTSLRLGSRGENVSIMQMALNVINQGWGNSNQLVVDGIFGAATEAAVRAFQTRVGLTADGIIGRNTWGAISEQYSVATNNAVALSEQNFELYRFLYENYTSLMYAIDNHQANL